MAAIVGPGGPSYMATKFAIDGQGGPVVAGDHLRRDRSRALCSSGAHQLSQHEYRYVAKEPQFI